ncbi:MAG: COR domain-containing protein [Cyanobacteria bacterium P01_A01_bin.135]
MDHNELRRVILDAAAQRLETLKLSYRHITILPTEIGQLTNLQSLYLIGNQLSSLPAEIGQLTNLQSLYLSDNQLSSLPAEIGQLTNLQSLGLIGNQLSRLPAEIGQLTNLRSLDLSGNQLSSLLTEIGQLTNLRSLYLIGNQLSNLPAEIGQLTNLQSLHLSDNPALQDPPPEVIVDGTAAILDYYRQQLEQGIDYLYEAKLLVVGEGEAGKTSLAKKLEDSCYVLNPQESSTEGIDVIRWDFKLADSTPFRFNIWDFGGQEIYHATHQFFLTKRSLYVLVIDTRKENTDLDYWLSVIELLSEGSPVLIVKNEKQDRTCQINELALRGKFLGLKETVATNLGSQDNRGLAEVVETIQRYASQFQHVGTPLPKKWVDVRRALEEDSRNYISVDEYYRICEANGFERRDDQIQLSDFLHDLGVCLHFRDDPLLKRVLILKPEWGTTAVYNVLDTKAVIDSSGKFSRQQLNSIWQDAEYADMRDELLQLMMRFKVCYEIPRQPGSYIAPSLLPVEQRRYDWDAQQNLTLRYDYEFMPKGMITRFIVELHPWIEDQTLVWKSGVVLQKDSARAEVIEDYSQRRIRIRVAGNRKKELLAVINHEFEKIHDSYEQLKYETKVPCNCDECADTQSPYLYKLENLRRLLDKGRPDTMCQESGDMVGIRQLIDDVIPSSSEQAAQTQQWQTELEREKSKGLNQNTPIKVFISYSWDSEPHKQKVLTLSNQLRAHGIDCQIDRYQQNPPENWYRWMMNQIEESEYVLVVCSKGYERRYRNKEARGQGKGVTWEGGLSIEALYTGQGLNEKYIPVLLSAEAEPHIPPGLKGYTVYQLFDEAAYRPDQPGPYQDLLRYLTSQPAYSPPALGTVPELPPVS